nr:hypothetical protein Iba_chr02cCG7270 [Ipomoea batatas]
MAIRSSSSHGSSYLNSNGNHDREKDLRSQLANNRGWRSCSRSGRGLPRNCPGHSAGGDSSDAGSASGRGARPNSPTASSKNRGGVLAEGENIWREAAESASTSASASIGMFASMRLAPQVRPPPCVRRLIHVSVSSSASASSMRPPPQSVFASSMRPPPQATEATIDRDRASAAFGQVHASATIADAMPQPKLTVVLSFDAKLPRLAVV